MPDPTPVGDHLGRGPRSLAEIEAKRDRLLARIEDEDLIPQWCWAPMTDTVGLLSGLGDDLAWIVPAYLSAVITRGPKLFNAAAHQLAINAEADTVECRCGAAAPADPLVRRNGRLVRTARCRACGHDLAIFDEEAYDRETLLSGGMV